jgi:uncharacterized metal-binding protein
MQTCFGLIQKHKELNGIISIFQESVSPFGIISFALLYKKEARAMIQLFLSKLKFSFCCAVAYVKAKIVAIPLID